MVETALDFSMWVYIQSVVTQTLNAVCCFSLSEFVRQKCEITGRELTQAINQKCADVWKLRKKILQEEQK